MTAGRRWCCTYRRCTELAAGFVEPPNGPGICYGCTGHLPAMAKALSIGFGFSDEADVTMLHTKEDA
jgi:hypothetical protein